MYDKILVYKGIARLALEGEKDCIYYVAIFEKRESKRSFVYSSLESIAMLVIGSIVAEYEEEDKNLKYESEMDLAHIFYDGQPGTLVQRLDKDKDLKLPKRTRLIDLEHLTETEIKEFKKRVLKGLVAADTK